MTNPRSDSDRNANSAFANPDLLYPTSSAHKQIIRSTHQQIIFTLSEKCPSKKSKPE